MGAWGLRYFEGMADVHDKETRRAASIPKAKIKFFQERLLKWYATDGRRFYWRRKGLTNYQYIIAEVLLQRTKAETVAKFFPIFISHFPNWRTLANADVLDIAEHLKPVGLYTQRSIRLKKLAQEMVKRNGRLPRDREELEAIPFIGQYIANAIELVIFDEPSPLIDVNMARVLERFFGPRTMADIRYDPYLQDLSYKVVDHASAKEMNWAVLDFAAIVCKPRPLCIICCLNSKCIYYESAFQAHSRRKQSY